MLACEQAQPSVEDDLCAIMLRFGNDFVRWSVENLAYSAAFWRPVPGYRPSEAAYEPAVALYQQGYARLAALKQRGLLRADAEVEAALRDWTVLVSGVVSQRLANAPGEPFESGQFTTAMPGLRPCSRPTTAIRRATARRRNPRPRGGAMQPT